MNLPIRVEPHPALALAAFTTTFVRPLGELAGIDPRDPARLTPALARSEARRAAVRELLRHGGYKPTGRGKPASEYLVQAAERGTLASINLAVDAGNLVSLHSGLPISVVDLDRCVLDRGGLRVAIAGDARYVFNAAGQEIDLRGLICLFDAEGPCANAVRDSQRTKTHDGTTRTLSVVWGLDAVRDRLAAATDWYRALLADLGAATEAVEVDQ